MNISTLGPRISRAAADNSPVILTALGAAGVLTTAYLTGKASFRAAEYLREESNVSFPGDLTFNDKIRLTWLMYLPAVGSGAMTVTCIVLANRIGARRAAAVAAAYTISERAFDEYRNKVVEKLGETKERAVRDEIAQERVARLAEQHPTVVVSREDGLVMCHDAFSNQFFHSDMEALRRAMNDTNQQIMHMDFAMVSDFYEAIGSPDLRETDASRVLGWNTDDFLDLTFTTVLYKDKIPCISVSFNPAPKTDPNKFR